MDKKLAEALKLAKSKTKDSPMHFALVLKGGSDGALVVDKKKAAKEAIEEAKSKCGGTGVVRGICYGGNNGVLLFETGKKPVTTWEAAVKKIAARDAKVSIDPEFVFSKDLAAEDGDAPGPDRDEHLEEVKEGVELKSRGAESWAKKLEESKATIEKAIARKNEKSPSIEKAYQNAQKLAKSGEFGRAISLLEGAYREAEQATAEKPKGISEAALLFKDQLKVTQTLFKTLEKEDGARAKALAKHLQKAIKLGAESKYEESYIALLEVQRLVQASLDNIEWEKRIDVKQLKVKSDKIGKGGFGSIFMIESTDPNAPPLVMKKGSNLKEEAEMYKKVGDHPNIAKCLGHMTIGDKKPPFEDEGLVMEAIKGGSMEDGMKSLGDRLKKNQISQEDYWGVMQFTMKRTLEALDFVRSKGFTHCDVKPDNIMFDEATGEVKLIDFGITGESGKATGGTFSFRAPETLGEGGDEKSDAFSLGSTAFQIGEGKRFDYNDPDFFEKLKKVNHPAMGQFMQIETIDAYGKGDQNALSQEDSERDEKGNAKKKAGKFGAKTAYVDFVMRMMDPDPKNRMTLQEAMNHPFMKDSMVSEDRAKELITGIKGPAPKSTTDEHTAPPPSGQQKSTGGRDISSLRPKIAQTVRLAVGREKQAVQVLQQIQTGIADLTDVNALSKTKDQILEFKTAFASALDDVRESLNVLNVGIPTNVAPNDTEAAEDVRNRDTLARIEGVIANLIGDLDRALSTIEQAFNNPKNQKEQARQIRKGNLFTEADVKFKNKLLADHLDRVTKLADGVLANPNPMVERQFESLKRVENEIGALRDQAAGEVKAIGDLAVELAKQKPGPLAKKSEKQEFVDTLQRIKSYRSTLEAQIKKLNEQILRLSPETQGAKRSTEDKKNTAAQAVQRLMRQLTTLVRNIDVVENGYTDKAKDFQVLAKVARTSNEEKEEFSRMAGEFSKQLDRFEKGAEILAVEMTQVIDDLIQHQERFSQTPGLGQEDVYGQIGAKLTEARTQEARLQRLKTLITADRNSIR